MPRRSAVEALPKAVRAWLDGALIEGNFSGYELLEAELQARGYSIGKSSVHRYGQQLERKLASVRASTQAATAIAEAAPDDADLRSAAVMSMIQTDVFNVLVTLQEAESADPQERLKLLSRAAKSIAELSRASVNQKRWQVEVRDKARAAAETVAKLAKKGGLSADAVDSIRREILGIAA